ncbi:folylpolyglutamate synthase, mitochondrial-like isoform X2 [Saccostrea echinata]|uniref:folylpolyglutamate synthase, mitochondrial-like isoform X2 n=1 Tax=Saccostrea echinata TaxID=191078 RepID=UPI002A841A70|nr:folylpolyglutamate synthase, mitochondrial-like isoform X2 [Saccostrea echinata]
MSTKVLRSLSSLASTVENSKKYEEAVTALNTLQSNAQTLEKIRQQGGKKAELNIPNMIKFAERVGITLDDVDKLSIIHVSGTKGKGSTCAFCESILRHQGYKTGFFSSPHLVEVRERFRINGIPITRDKFTDYFWDVFGRLEKTKESFDGSMPTYFSFLTVMSLYVFLKEEVDVAIMEVGIGGQYDSTNLIRKPVACGVASLGLDHTSILGDTVDKIAWHKAGIFKPSVPAVTSPQPDIALNVIKERAKEIGCPLSVAPSLSLFESVGQPLSLGIAGHMQRQNAALAIQLCKLWIDNRRKQQKNMEDDQNGKTTEWNTEDMRLPSSVTEGLKHCRWDGRNQTIKKPGITYYLDGAHTLESVQQCIQWFRCASAEESEKLRGHVIQVLVFNSTGDREASVLIEPLVNCGFDAAVFCPNIAFSTLNTVARSTKTDATNFTVTKESQLNRVLANMLLFERLAVKRLQQQKHEKETTQRERDNTRDAKRPRFSKLDTHNIEDKGDNSQTVCDIEDCVITKDFPCISSALNWATQGKEPNISSQSFTEFPSKVKDADHIQILVTGSLHLVGGVIGLIGPE